MVDATKSCCLLHAVASVTIDYSGIALGVNDPASGVTVQDYI